MTQGGVKKMNTTHRYQSTTRPPESEDEFNRRLRRAGIGERQIRLIDELFTKSGLVDSPKSWLDSYENIKNRLGEARSDSTIEIILGPRGTGKTTMASLLIAWFAWWNRPCKYVTASEFLRDVIESFDAGLDPRPKCEKCKLLVIDEFHRAPPTDHSIRTLEALVDKRYANLLDTVIVSNDTEQAFCDKAGKSISSRATQIGSFTVVRGHNFRKREDVHRR